MGHFVEGDNGIGPGLVGDALQGIGDLLGDFLFLFAGEAAGDADVDVGHVGS